MPLSLKSFELGNLLEFIESKLILSTDLTCKIEFIIIWYFSILYTLWRYYCYHVGPTPKACIVAMNMLDEGFCPDLRLISAILFITLCKLDIKSVQNVYFIFQKLFWWLKVLFLSFNVITCNAASGVRMWFVILGINLKKINLKILCPKVEKFAFGKILRCIGL